MKKEIVVPLLKISNSEDEPHFKSNPYIKASFISKVFFCWIFPLLDFGRKTYLNKKVLYPIQANFKSEVLFERFNKQWILMKNRKYPVHWTVYKAFKKEIFLYILYEFLNCLFAFSTPLIINRIIAYSSSEDKEIWYSSTLLIGIFIIKALSTILNTHSDYLLNSIGILIMNSLNMKIYTKSLKFPLLFKSEYNEGKLVNIVQTDLELVKNLFGDISSLLFLPLQIVVGMIFIYYIMGVSTLTGFGFILFIGIMNYFTGKYYTKLQENMMTMKDQRIKLSDEILTNIKYIKINTEELFYLKKLTNIRSIELIKLIKQHALDVFYVLLFQITPMVVTISTFFIYISLDNELNSEKVFTILSLFQTLSGLLSGFPSSITDLINCHVSFNRIKNFLKQKDNIKKKLEYPLNFEKDTAILIQNGNFSWETRKNDIIFNHNHEDLECLKSDKMNIYNLNIRVKTGAFIAIYGTNSSGKTSFLNALLGEMKISKELNKEFGMLINGTLAYVNQIPWIQNMTLKENILFGLPMEHDKYKLVLKLTYLEEDLKMLKNGDEIMIGNNGINLSGGQKSRLSLARSLYADKDIYLIDDVFSSIDAYLSKQIFKKCLQEHLKGRTRIFITQNFQYLKNFDYIYVMNDGKIVDQGDYELISRNGFWKDNFKKNENDKNQLIQRKFDENNILENIQDNVSINKKESSLTMNFSTNLIEIPRSIVNNQFNSILDDLMLAEDRKYGTIGWKLLKSFIKYNGNYVFAFLVILIMIIWIFLQVSSNLWLTYWMSSNDSSNNNFYLKMYALIVITYGFFCGLKVAILFIGGYICSLKLHNRMIKSLLLAPTNEFFDRVPKGRILNRLSKDLFNVDIPLPNILASTLEIIFSLCADFALACYAIKYWIVIPSFFMISYLVYLQRIFIKNSRELTRLEAISKSAVVGFFTETIAGLSTIRSLGHEERFMTQHSANLNENIRTLLLRFAVNNWFWQRSGFACLIISITISGFILFLNFQPSIAGLILIYTYSMEGDIRFFISNISSSECELISFERCEAITCIPHEVGHVNIDENLKPYNNEKNWPDSGNIEFQNVFIKYRENLDFVLKDLSFSINSGEKIGVVGTTGAGKSTLALAILRMMETTNGKIIIDGIDISTIAVRELRRKITLIPQEPCLFEGSLKENLDPNGDYGKEVLLKYLEKVNLDKELESKIEDQGKNLSAGEKQLISLCRAMMKNNKIILMDEATANIDLNSEMKIQEFIHEKFKDSTVITITHRVHNLLNKDRIMVIEKGKIVEFDKPEILLQDKSSIFFKLWQNGLSLE